MKVIMDKNYKHMPFTVELAKKIQYPLQLLTADKFLIKFDKVNDQGNFEFRTLKYPCSYKSNKDIRFVDDSISGAPNLTENDILHHYRNFPKELSSIKPIGSSDIYPIFLQGL